MEKSLVKEAFKEAENSLREEQKGIVKDIVLKTLEKLKKVQKELKEKQEEEKILKLDIEDLKEGKIDRIVERQATDPKAKEVSVVIIIKEKEVIREVERSPWSWPYQVIWQVPYKPVYYQNAMWHNTNTTGLVYTTTTNGFNVGGSKSYTLDDGSMTINCSIAKDATIGTYNVCGNIVHLR